MCWRRSATAATAVAVLAVVAVLVQPSPPVARANVPCDVATGPAGLVGDAIGIGNPAGDVCNTVTGGIGAVGGAITSPVTGALKGIGNSVFEQLTSWVAEGAGWLMGQVVEAIDSSTTPRLETEGFLRAYGRMAAIAAILAAVMLLFAILEGIAQGNPGLLVRVVVLNVPLAFLATSVAFAIVQLLLTCTDELSAAIANTSHHDSTHFFEAAIGDLGHVGSQVGKQVGEAAGEKGTEGFGGEAAGAVAAPLFVGFLAAIVGAFAAFFVWLELLMRDAAVYAVALFMPFPLAASISPRWGGATRRTGELLIAVIGSKFVIVAILALAASLVAEDQGSVELILVAAALMCLACFAPFVLLRMISTFSESALAAAYGRRSAAGGAVSAMSIGSDAMLIRNMARSRGAGSGVSLWSASEGGGSSEGGGGAGAQGSGGGRPGGPFGGGKGPGDVSGSAGIGAEVGGGGLAASSPAGAAAAVASSATKAPQQAAGRLEHTAVAEGAGTSDGDQGGGAASGSSARPPQSAQPDSSSQTGVGEADSPPPSTAERPPRPSPDAPPPAERPPRPAPEPPGPKGEESGDER